MQYEVIGWYSYDVHNPLFKPFARVVTVEAANEEEAFDFGYRELRKLSDSIAATGVAEMLNWYVSPKKEQP